MQRRKLKSLIKKTRKKWEVILEDLESKHIESLYDALEKMQSPCALCDGFNYRCNSCITTSKCEEITSRSWNVHQKNWKRSVKRICRAALKYLDGLEKEHGL